MLIQCLAMEKNVENSSATIAQNGDDAGAGKSVSSRKRLFFIVGLALLWPSLHLSPYYPISLTPDYAAQSSEILSAQHFIYAVALMLLFAAAIGFRAQIAHAVAHFKSVVIVSGVAGGVGSVVLLVVLQDTPGYSLIEGVALAFVAAYVVVAVTGWFSVASGASYGCFALDICLSYCLFTALSFVFSALGDTATSVFMALCPFISMALLAKMTFEPAQILHAATANLRRLPWQYIIVCVVFVYLGVIGVRAFTAIGFGVEPSGLSAFARMVTAATGFVLAAVGALCFRRRTLSQPATVSIIAVLMLFYIGALLLIMVSDPTSEITLVGKRILVGAEHCFEVFLAIVCVHAVSRTDASPLVVFGLYGIFVCTLPQFIVTDLMVRSGLLAMFGAMSIATPLAAVVAFILLALGVGLFLSSAAKGAKLVEGADGAAGGAADTQETQSLGPEAICRVATEGLDITGREFDVLVYVYRGYSAKKIGECLLVSESTVKTHISHIYRKLDIHTKQELIEYIDARR